jgi:hypothetical protein
MRYIVTNKDIKPLLKDYSPIEIENAAIAIFLDELRIHDLNNKLLASIISKVSPEQTKKIKNHFNKAKIKLSLETLTSLLEILIPRNKRNMIGAFYTPNIVANFLVEQTISKESRFVCDPSCGVGSLLVASTANIARYRHCPIVDVIENCIYGVDLEPSNINHTKVILSLLSLQYGEDPDKINFNLHVGNALRINWHKEFEQIFEINGGFDAVLSNPPYATTNEKDLIGLESRFSCGKNLQLTGVFLPFIELLFKILRSSNSIAGYVVPLSLAFNISPPFMRLRQIISQAKGEWRFSFYDRSPDSLFGDNIKIRNCIFFYKKMSSNHVKIQTTHLMRWNSQMRNRLFENLKYQTIDSLNIIEGIPKISEEIELDTLSRLSSTTLCIDNKIKFGVINEKQSTLDSFNLNSLTIFYYSTAYNWLSAFRILPQKTNNLRHILAGSYNTIICRSSDEADFLYGCLNSRLAYWYWLVFGDGFHMNKQFIQKLPFNPDVYDPFTKKTIGELGRKLAECASLSPIYKINAGKITINYNMLKCIDIVQMIDLYLIKKLGIKIEFLDFLNKRIYSHIGAGRISFKNKEMLTKTGE